nr:hypothetical protein Itr_chr11CG18420 [Ipomoea trifida]
MKLLTATRNQLSKSRMIRPISATAATTAAVVLCSTKPLPSWSHPSERHSRRPQGNSDSADYVPQHSGTVPLHPLWQFPYPLLLLMMMIMSV